MEILSPGKKLRTIRNKFGIKQSEITGGEITRELISIIENDKCRIMPQVAKIIAYNINKICRERNIDFVLEPSYLLEDVKTQAIKIAENYIEILNSYNKLTSESKKVLNEVEAFLMKYDVDDKKIILYEKLGDIYKNSYQYNKSYEFYIKALENNKKGFKNEALFKLIQKLGAICMFLGRYEDALNFNDLALSYKDNVPENLKYVVYFNNLLCYFYMKDYRRTLEEINSVKVNFKKLLEIDLFELNSLKSNCLVHLENYSEALEIDKKLLEQLAEDDISNRLMVLGNMLDIYIIIKDIDNIEQYMTKIVYELSIWKGDNIPFFLPNLYCQLECAAILIGDFNAAKEYFNTLVDLCKVSKNIYAIKSGLKLHIELLSIENSEEEMNILKGRLLELIALGA